MKSKIVNKQIIYKMLIVLAIPFCLLFTNIFVDSLLALGRVIGTLGRLYG